MNSFVPLIPEVVERKRSFYITKMHNRTRVQWYKIYLRSDEEYIGSGYSKLSICSYFKQEITKLVPKTFNGKKGREELSYHTIDKSAFTDKKQQRSSRHRLRLVLGPRL